MSLLKNPKVKLLIVTTLIIGLIPVVTYAMTLLN